MATRSFQKRQIHVSNMRRKKNLHPHHIEPFAKNKEKRFEIKNGKTLCAKCHGIIHGIDYMKNTKKITCKHCKKKFSVKEGHYNHQFCGKTCAYAYRVGKPSKKKGKRYPHLDKYPIRKCLECEKEFKATVHKTRNQKYCSSKCYLKARWGSGQEATKQ